MPKVSNKDIYAQDPSLDMEDYLLGTNYNSTNKKTQTYSLSSIFSLFYNFLGYNAFLFTTDTDTYPIASPGCFFAFDEHNEITSDFQQARKLTFSSNDTYNFNVTEYLQMLVDSDKFLFKLINLEDKNNFIFLKPRNFTLSNTLTSFDVNIEIQYGLSNGNFVNYKKYLLLLEFDANTFDPADYDLTDFTNTSVNPFITEQDLTNAIALLPTPISNHSELNLDDGTNPHGTTKSDVGLSNVDNTSDVDKPISTATQQALDLKADAIYLDNLVPYTGATQNVDLGEFELRAGQVEFDTTPTGNAGVGILRWNNSDGTLDLGLKGGNVTLQIGQEQVVRVVNKTGSNLLESNYQAVRVNGAQGQRLKVALAQATNDLLSAETIGLVTENIDNNQEGFVTTNGLIRGINTTGSLQGETWADGDILYLSPSVAGKITNIKPSAPNHLIVVGYVVYAHANNGSIFVKVDNGYELEELHNVTETNYTTPIDTDSVLTFDVNNSLWKRLSWANIKSNLKTYFDTLYLSLSIFNDFVTAMFDSLDNKLDKSSTPSSVYTTDADGLQVMKPISEFQTPVGDYVTVNTTQTVTGNKTFNDVGLIKKNQTYLSPDQSGGNFYIGGTSGYDNFDFYSFDGLEGDGFGSSQIYSNPEEGNCIRHTSLDNNINAVLQVNQYDTHLRHQYGGQNTSIYVDGQTDKIIIEGTQNKFAALGTSLITGNKNFEFPDQSGTLALLSDLSGFTTPSEVATQITTAINSNKTSFTHNILASDWTLVSGKYEAVISNAGILANSFVDVIPSNDHVDIVRNAQIYPSVLISAGSVKVYSKFLPSDTITVTININ